MKKILASLTMVAALAFAFVSCDKVDDLPVYQAGKAVQLSASAAVVAPAASDSDNVVLRLEWTNPEYAQDSSLYKYVIEVDSAGRDFSRAARKEVVGVRSASFIAKEMNTILLGFGFNFNVEYGVQVRVVSSYGNNNERYVSNVINLRATPYRIPPRIPVPANLYIVGDLNGWNNSPTLDKRFYFSKIDQTTYGGVFNFSGSGVYKLIQELGNWDTQYRMIPGGTGTAGGFVQENSDPAFPFPSPAGWYRVRVDFQNARYTAEPVVSERYTPPADLYLVGDINGWNNSSSLSNTFKFTKVDDFVYTLNVNFTAAGNYKLIQQLGNWGTQFRMVAGGNSSGGEFKQEDSDPPFPNPSTPGNYKITVNFATNLYTVERLP